MRRPLKCRLIFLSLAVICFSAGFYFLPEQINTQFEKMVSASFAVIYFVVLPLLYWLLIIKAGNQKPWKMILIFSLSAAVARFSFAPQIAEYFDFVMWLRIPIIVLLIALEFFLFTHVIKSLWQARKLKGDPRVHMLNKMGNEGDEKKLQMSLTLSYEPASWYYALPFLSRTHATSVGRLKLLSGHFWHLLLLLTGLVILTAISYFLIASFSELVAIIVASIIGYSLISICANYRISRYFSAYILNHHLVINHSFLSLMVIPLDVIKGVEQGNWSKHQLSESLVLGRGKQANIELTFNQQVGYFSMMGMINEAFEKVYLVVENPECFVKKINQSDNIRTN